MWVVVPIRRVLRGNLTRAVRECSFLHRRRRPGTRHTDYDAEAACFCISFFLRGFFNVHSFIFRF